MASGSPTYLGRRPSDISDLLDTWPDSEEQQFVLSGANTPLAYHSPRAPSSSGAAARSPGGILDGERPISI